MYVHQAWGRTIRDKNKEPTESQSADAGLPCTAWETHNQVSNNRLKADLVNCYKVFCVHLYFWAFQELWVGVAAWWRKEKEGKGRFSGLPHTYLLLQNMKEQSLICAHRKQTSKRTSNIRVWHQRQTHSLSAGESRQMQLSVLAPKHEQNTTLQCFIFNSFHLQAAFQPPAPLGQNPHPTVMSSPHLS